MMSQWQEDLYFLGVVITAFLFGAGGMYMYMVLV